MSKSLSAWAERHGVSSDAMAELSSIIDPSLPLNPSGNEGEAMVQSKLRVYAATVGCSLWRNNNGAARDDQGRFIRFGLGNDSQKLSAVWKSSDLIGITPIKDKASGKTYGVFTAVEAKRSGWIKPTNDREKAQMNFLRTVTTMGGIAMFAQSVNDYDSVITIRRR